MGMPDHLTCLLRNLYADEEATFKNQTCLAFLYTKNEKTEREIKETISFTIATKRIKYLGIRSEEAHV